LKDDYFFSIGKNTVTIISNLKVSRRLVEKGEIIVTVFWLLYFMRIELPPPIPESLVNALSYPSIAILAALHWKRLSWIATRDITLLILIGLSFASVFWSVAPDITLNASRGLLRMLLFGAYLTTRYSIKEQIKIIALALGMGAILSIVAALAIPSYGVSLRLSHGGAFTGIFPHKNYLGYAMVLGTITFLILSLQERKPNLLFWSGFCLTVIPLTRSSASLASLLFLLSLMPLYQFSNLKYRQKMILFCLILILVGAFIAFILNNLETILVDILGESVEFSGRTPIWTLVIEKVVEERLWIGYGFSAFWKSSAGAYVIANTWAAQDVVMEQSFNFHNAYLPTFSSLGFIGFLFYIVSLTKTFTRVVTLFLTTKKIEFFWMFQFLNFILIGGFADDAVSILNSSSYCVTYISICLSSILEYKKLNYRQAKLISA
jgi:exopolysaccharide production protein ExoQ